jgi:hypothetical protein
MVAAGWAQTARHGNGENKQSTNFRHGEVPAKEASFIRGMSAFFHTLFG